MNHCIYLCMYILICIYEVYLYVYLYIHRKICLNIYNSSFAATTPIFMHIFRSQQSTSQDRPTVRMSGLFWVYRIFFGLEFAAIGSSEVYINSVIIILYSDDVMYMILWWVILLA